MDKESLCSGAKWLLSYLTTKPDAEVSRIENSRTLCMILLYGAIGCVGLFITHNSTEGIVACFIAGSFWLYCIGHQREIRKYGTLAIELLVFLILIAVTLADCLGYPDEPVFLFPLTVLVLPPLIFDVPWKVEVIIIVSCVFALKLASSTGGLVHQGFRIWGSTLISMINTCYVVHHRRIAVELRQSTKVKAEQDPLTGIYNRGGGTALICDCIELQQSGTFFIIDVDDFKDVNDRYGHQAGDEVLRKVASVLQSSFKETDIVMRMGGDEFIVYAVGMVDYKVSEKRLQRLVEEMRKVIPVSIGAMINDGSYPTYDSLYKAADVLLYQTKEKGKNGFTLGNTSYRLEKK